MTAGVKRKLRWGLLLTLAASIFFFGWRLRGRARQVAWHVAHHSELQLSRTVYTVPLQWRVLTQDSSVAFLVDAPLSLGKIRTTTVTLGESRENKDALDGSALADEKESFANNGKLMLVRRFHTDFQDAVCLEGTRREFPADYFVECHGSAGTFSFFTGDPDLINGYYAILETGRLR